VPVLARLFEAAGMSTVTVTNMPFWSERVGMPRSLGVEFPFGHILGQAHNRELQRRVILQALDVLEKAEGPGAIVHFQEPWPEPLEAARRASEPDPPPPIGAQMGRHIGKILMGLRRDR
jgi:D-proline reductase (dithiol) PrdB